MNTDFTFFLNPKKERPDFRLVITWLWNDLQNVDTEGNSYNPASKEWTELYIVNRENKNEKIDIYPITENPLLLEISATTKELSYKLVYFLSEQTEGDIFMEKEMNNIISKTEILNHIDSKWLEDAKKRIDNSIWKNITLENPYPS
ncbi:hypothetical protein WAF17_17295 [Bernardetia sp. ABR2-2B]|uniref:hypothetical protein n=1 Tax=Bernardetia sp. ABR2-2B TaxID=3127472 RepID=UPI0030D49052